MFGKEEKKILSSSPRAQVVENQTRALVIKLIEFQQKFNTQPHRVCKVKGGPLIGKEWDRVT